MKSAFALSMFLAIVASVSAGAVGTPTNAELLKRGLPPRAPRKLYAPTRVSAAKRQSPSGVVTATADTCTTGQLLCCNELTPADSTDATNALASIDVTLTSSQDVGLGCTALTTDGTCDNTPACCDGTLDGVVSIGCTAVTLGG
ncbi:hypothetical protein PUNSTDRAFT_117225 [Punctularia strigosozonata HHB-11173 SS5]|uniref:uncharacterized protein n=1 Tax=Punctularia strigosozonata (strain HHB-11173) TaxID=741275 RepID=UPI0004417151|nr:uncharacterized protein PUNSTDRAFT_117225 [Punctularia strigosozonata HHB-11173 SS5]EIN13449.1 hypothetical protein PUNSTDRAFT_117225 [Punctularia strigosozonata HHB-11173 SS5]